MTLEEMSRPSSEREWRTAFVTLTLRYDGKQMAIEDLAQNIRGAVLDNGGTGPAVYDADVEVTHDEACDLT